MGSFLSQVKQRLTQSENTVIVRCIAKWREHSIWKTYKTAQDVESEYLHLKGKRKCFVFLAADYGNLGDVAITYAQEKYLKERFPDYEIVDIPISVTISHLKTLKKICSEEDIITVTGGGYMGDLYVGAELIRQLVFKVFKHHKIISFPQTADFSDTAQGRCMLKQAERIYGRCSNMELWAREERSYAFMKEHFSKNKVRLTPDIVMSLDETRGDEKRSGVTFCLRNDKEKNDKTDSFVSQIRTILEKHSNAITNYDTHIGDVQLGMEQRMVELTNIWNQFRRSKLVVTDRLHGMIFAYITGSPAIVLPNNNFKVTEAFKWIEKCGYIHVLHDTNSIESSIENLLAIRNEQINDGFSATHDHICQVFHSISLFQ